MSITKETVNYKEKTCVNCYSSFRCEDGMLCCSKLTQDKNVVSLLGSCDIWREVR